VNDCSGSSADAFPRISWYTPPVKFVDELVIEVESGKGGDGMIAFRREKFVPFGGPSGGDGGRGGDVVMVATRDLNTLYELSYQRIYRAEPGVKGGIKDMFGADAPETVIRVPVGTLVYDMESGELLADLARADDRFIAARGGRGGKGNARFASSVRRAPRIAEKGEPGELKHLRLELKLLADVGLVGLPNAGKSTLLRAISNARPKVADYPFTTLVPNLGIVKPEGLPSFCVADLPGLIEGAHMGAGLGIQFLKHIERTRLLVHLVDLSGIDPDEPLATFDVIMRELAEFDERLVKRPMLVVGNKMDLPEAREMWPVFVKALKRRKLPVFPLSGATKEGTQDLAARICEELAKMPSADLEAPAAASEKVFAYLPPFRIEPLDEGSWIIRGPEIERLVAMTDFTSDESVARFRKKIKKMGLIDEMSRTEAGADDTVSIGEMEFAWREFFS